MENEIIKLASSQGIWAVLSVFLLYYIIRSQEKRDLKQDEREAKYQDLLQKALILISAVDRSEKNLPRGRCR